MTICVACTTKDDQGNPIVLIGSDTEVCLGNERLADLDLDSKLYALGPIVVGISGSGSVAETLKILQEDKRFVKKIKYQTEKDIRDFAMTFFSNYKALLEQGVATADDTSVGALLVATPTAIYSVYNDLTVFKHKHFCVTGAGDSVARGLMLALMEPLKKKGTEAKLRKVLKKALLKTCENVVYCGGPIVIMKPGEVK